MGLQGQVHQGVVGCAETGQALSCLIHPDGFPEVDRMAGRFPETTIIIDHLGRIGADGTIRDAKSLVAILLWERLRQPS